MIRFVLVTLLATACADVGDGQDILPKAGELAVDPTIISTTVRCVTTVGEHVREIWTEVAIMASDSKGYANLDWCSATRGVDTHVAWFPSATYSYLGCTLSYPICQVGDQYIMKIKVRNKPGGTNIASVMMTEQ